MAQLIQYVNASGDDWDDLTSVGTEIMAQKVFQANPHFEQAAYCRIDTSSIPDTATITSATLWWYDHSYVSSKGLSQSRVIWILNVAQTAYGVLYASTLTLASGWQSRVFPAARLEYINKTAKTQFRFTVADPPEFQNRSWRIRAWDGYNAFNEQCYLVVNYSDGGRKKTAILR